MEGMELIYIIGILLLLAGCTAPELEVTPELKPTRVLSSALPPSDTPLELLPSQPSDTVTPPTLTQGATITVTNPSDSDPGSLRKALEIAQDYDTITFDTAVFPIDAPITIPITSELPHIKTNNLTLDASEAGVVLDGSQVPGDWTAGLQIVNSSENTIRGLKISNFSGPGIAISGDSRNNFIGGDRDQGVGPFGEGNMLTENGQGISLAETGTTLNTFAGNLIGTDARGSAALGNLGDGISISREQTVTRSVRTI